MAKKSKKSSSAKTKTARKPARAARKGSKSSKSKETRFIMVVDLALKNKMKAAAKKASAKAGKSVSMSEWVRQTLTKAMR